MMWSIRDVVEKRMRSTQGAHKVVLVVESHESCASATARGTA
jgi:hypothetical protein